jgi:hypothetical protein
MSAIVGSRVVADPPLARFLFADTRLAPLSLVVRLYVGFAWLDAGWHKVTDTGATTNYIIDGPGTSRSGSVSRRFRPPQRSRSLPTTGTATSSNS